MGSVALSGVAAMSFVNAKPPATRRAEPAGATWATPGPPLMCAVPRPFTTIAFHTRSPRPQSGMGHERPRRAPAAGRGPRALADQQAPVRQPVDAERKAERRVDHHLAAAREVDRQDLLGTPVREPQPALLPAERLPQREPGTSHAAIRDRVDAGPRIRPPAVARGEGR